MEGSVTKLRMRINLSGVTSTGAGKEYHNLRRGDVVEADEFTMRQFLAAGYAQRDLVGELGRPYEKEVEPNW
jgi:hypothetical protein